jgi:hypothetical protein
MTVLELTLKRLSEKPELFAELEADKEEPVAHEFTISYIDGRPSDDVATAPASVPGNDCGSLL